VNAGVVSGLRGADGTASHATALRAMFDSVVIISPFVWQDMLQTTDEIALEMARCLPVVLIEPPPRWNMGSEQFRGRRLLANLFGARTHSPQDGLTVFHGYSLPGGRYAPVREWNRRRNAAAIRSLLRQLGFGRPLLWHSFPYGTEELMDAVRPKRFVYHCLDYTDQEEEAALVRRADVVFAVSDVLVRRHRALNPHTFLLPNGVNLKMFSAEAALGRPRPPDLPTAGRLIGYIGKIVCYLDIELLLKVARSFPRDYLILIGPVMTNETAPRKAQADAWRTLASLPNVRALGFRPPSQLAPYIHAFDACVIANLPHRFNMERDPLKFYQYLAMGKPVVTTPVSAAQCHRGLCYLADSADSFMDGVARALGEADAVGSEALRRARMTVARQHSWESLVAGAYRIVLERGAREDPTCVASRPA